MLNGHPIVDTDDRPTRDPKEDALQELLNQKELLLQEVQHRIGNSLQIIASILLVKARAIRSEKARLHLLDAYRRVMSIGALHRQLQTSTPPAMEFESYLSRLCEILASSMIDESRPILLNVQVRGDATSSSQALSIGFIVTELVINALKHAFPRDRNHAAVIVAYDRNEPNWRLTVSDNGVGKPNDHTGKSAPGLGTTIVQALAKQLDARVDISMNSLGTTVSVIHAPLAPTDMADAHIDR